MSYEPNTKFKTMGEALVRRELAEDPGKHGHYAPGQLDGYYSDEEGVAYVSFVDAMGHAVVVPFEWIGATGGGWKLVGIYQRAGHYTSGGIAVLPAEFKPSDEQRALLERLRAEHGLD